MECKTAPRQGCQHGSNRDDRDLAEPLGGHSDGHWQLRRTRLRPRRGRIETCDTRSGGIALLNPRLIAATPLGVEWRKRRPRSHGTESAVLSSPDSTRNAALVAHVRLCLPAIGSPCRAGVAGQQFRCEQKALSRRDKPARIGQVPALFIGRTTPAGTACPTSPSILKCHALGTGCGA